MEKLWIQNKFFEGIDKSAREIISVHLTSQKYLKKQLLFSPGDVLRDVILIEDGYLKIYALRDGKEVIIDILKSGDIWGPFQYCCEGNSSFFVEAMSDTVIHKMPYADFIDVVKRNPEISLRIISSIASRLEQSQLKIANIGSGNASTKVFGELRRLCQGIGKDQSGYCRICTRLSHQQIADMVGLTRESVTHAMNKLKNDKQIKVEGGAIYVNSEFV